VIYSFLVFSRKSEQMNPEKITTIITEDNLEMKIQNYVAKHNPKIYILTPSYGGTVYVNYLCSLMKTVELFNKMNIQFQIEFCKNDSLISRARNNLIAKAMTTRDTTHIMFIDSDIAWEPIDIVKLLMSEKELVGGVYPLKHYYWEKLVPSSQANIKSEKTQTPVEKWLDKHHKNQHLHSTVSESEMIQQNLLKYNINYLSNYLSIHHNLTEVKHLATGFMLIQRSVIERMIEAYPEKKYVDDVSFLQGDENDYAYALFDCGVEDGHYYSEDWMFCHRWKNLGGSIFVDVSIRLTHTGVEDYKGSFISTIL